jgi:hypothetical protein
VARHANCLLRRTRGGHRQALRLLRRSAEGYRRAIVGIDDAGAEQIGQMLTSAFANHLLAAAEEPLTAQ